MRIKTTLNPNSVSKSNQVDEIIVNSVSECVSVEKAGWLWRKKCVPSSLQCHVKGGKSLAHLRSSCESRYVLDSSQILDNQLPGWQHCHFLVTQITALCVGSCTACIRLCSAEFPLRRKFPLFVFRKGFGRHFGKAPVRRGETLGVYCWHDCKIFKKWGLTYSAWLSGLPNRQDKAQVKRARNAGSSVQSWEVWSVSDSCSYRLSVRDTTLSTEAVSLKNKVT